MPFHLSYPFVFEDNNKLYLIPESSRSNSIDLYECEEFPYKWSIKQTLIENFKGLDNTLYKKGDYFWLFTTLSQTDELHLFYSKTLFTKDWIPHPSNPLFTDVSKARMAGKIVNFDDRTYRFAQNGSKRYGYGMQLLEIKEISKTKFSEKNIQFIYPNWSDDLVATHTFNQTNRLSVIDGLIRRPKL